MCGIVGVFGEVSPFEFQQMVSSMSHRGPDHSGSVSIGDIHLGHARLSVIDLSVQSNQPLWDLNHRACIVFNGEIYNYKALRSELSKKGYSFASEGDAEVIVNLYLEYGAAGFSRLDGMFAFAIWDESERCLVLARDQYGVKPLYYCQNDSGFYFASEFKSLLFARTVKAGLNYDALFRTLVFLWSPGKETILSGVNKLKPGSYQVVKNRSILQESLFVELPQYAPYYKSVDRTKDEVLNAIDQAVSQQVVADVPVGAFLSGGLDSSLLVALAKSRVSSPLECFTIDTGESGQDSGADITYAKKVAEYLSVPLNVLEVSPDIVGLLPEMIYHLDELQADPAAINVMLISEHAKKKRYQSTYFWCGWGRPFYWVP